MRNVESDVLELTQLYVQTFEACLYFVCDKIRKDCHAEHSNLVAGSRIQVLDVDQRILAMTGSSPDEFCLLSIEFQPDGGHPVVDVWDVDVGLYLEAQSADNQWRTRN